MSIPFPSYKRTRSEAEEQRLFQAMATVNAAASPTNGLGAKPAGLVNDGNTCFFNSTFQALAATVSLMNLMQPVIFPLEEHTQSAVDTELANEPAHTTTGLATGSDGAKLLPKTIPSLQDSAVEPENAKLMPVTLAFERCLGRAWRAKDAAVLSSPAYKSFVANASGHPGGEALGTKSTASSRRNSLADHKAADAHLSIGSLLKELAKKYDQYDGVSLRSGWKLGVLTTRSSSVNKMLTRSCVISWIRCRWRKRISSRCYIRHLRKVLATNERARTTIRIFQEKMRKPLYPSRMRCSAEALSASSSANHAKAYPIRTKDSSISPSVCANRRHGLENGTSSRRLHRNSNLDEANLPVRIPLETCLRPCTSKAFIRSHRIRTSSLRIPDNRQPDEPPRIWKSRWISVWRRRETRNMLR